MKANELMIGDWVEVPFLEGKPKIVKVEEILYDEINPEWDETENYGGIKIKYVKPIPLTPEILKKNGFTHSFGDSDFYDYEKWEKKVDDKTIRVIKDHDGWFCRVDENKLTRSMGIAPDVHTMQNIICIGGIEKSIEL